jgi:IS6 family transposase
LWLCCKKKADLLWLVKKKKRDPIMIEQHPFKWRHFEAEVILLCVRWYLRYALSYRNMEEMMRERGPHRDHTTIYLWVQRSAPELEKWCRPHLKTCNDSWKVDETSIKIKKVWTYLYRAVDSQGNTLEFLLSPTRDAEAAKRFFLKALRSSANLPPRVGTIEEMVAHPGLPANDTTSRQAPRVINVVRPKFGPK